MEKFKIGNKKIKVSMPTGWHEVPFWKGQLILESNMNDVECIALLADASPTEIQESTDPDTVYYFLRSFTFLSRLPDTLHAPTIPRSVFLGSDRIIFPHALDGDEFDLGKVSIGQVADMRMAITNYMIELGGEESNFDSVTDMDTIKLCPVLVAIYLQKVIEKNYNYDRAMKLVDRISKEMSFKDVSTIGYFFLQRLAASINGPQNGSLKRSLKKRKRKREFMSLIRRFLLIRH